MIVVTTPTGQIGAQVLAGLVGAGEPVRALARDRSRIAAGLVDRVEVVEGPIDDPAALGRALDGAEGVFFCVPPDPRMIESKAYYAAKVRPLVDLLPGSTVRRVVLVSSGGVDRAREGYIAGTRVAEELIGATGVGFRPLRCGSFMENALRQVEPIKHQGMMFGPLAGDVKLPVVATRDIADRAVALLRDRSWSDQAPSAVHGPADLSGDEMAAIVAKVLGKPVRYQAVPGPAFEASLIERGQSPEAARGAVDMFREIAEGIHAADPRTPESTTPTTFESWCREVLKPAVG